MTNTTGDKAQQSVECLIERLIDYRDGFGSPPILISNVGELRGLLTEAIAALQSRPAGEVEPIGWVYQHDDTGRMTFCENDGINTPEAFQRLNPRHVLCGPAYSHPPAAGAARGGRVNEPTEHACAINWFPGDGDRDGILAAALTAAQGQEGGP